MKSLVSLVLAVLFHCTASFPTSPGSCVGGRSAAVGHETPSPIPSFADQGYNLVIDGQVVSDPSTVSLVVGSSYEIAIESTGSPFRGALIRVEGMGTLTPGENSGIASVCTGDVQGVGHMNSASKRVLSGNFAVEGGSSVIVDVTVVERNGRDDSVYSYQGYQLAVAGAAATTDAPVVSPTELPVMAPVTDVPVVAPTGAPVVVPTDMPVKAPVTAAPTEMPVVSPTETPVTAPVPVPTEIPIVSPTETPVIAPVADPTEMPVTEMPVTEAPVMAPVAAPVGAPVAAPAAPTSERCVRRRHKK